MKKKHKIGRCFFFTNIWWKRWICLFNNGLQVQKQHRCNFRDIMEDVMSVSRVIVALHASLDPSHLASYYELLTIVWCKPVLEDTHIETAFFSWKAPLSRGGFVINDTTQSSSIINNHMLAWTQSFDIQEIYRSIFFWELPDYQYDIGLKASLKTYET